MLLALLLLSEAAWGGEVEMVMADEASTYVHRANLSAMVRPIGSFIDIMPTLREQRLHSHPVNATGARQWSLPGIGRVDDDSGSNNASSLKPSNVKENGFDLEALLPDGESRILKASYLEKRPESGSSASDMLGLVDRKDRKGAWNLRVKSPVMGNRLTMFGELDITAFDPETGRGFSEYGQHMFKLGFNGSQGGFVYGAAHGYVGDNHKALIKSMNKDEAKFEKGRQGNKLWGGWRSDKFNLNASWSETWDNLDEDPTKPRLVYREGGVNFDYTLSSWPYVGSSLSYSQGTRKSSREPAGYEPHEDRTETVATGLYYSSEIWDASVSSSYSRTKNALEWSDLPSTKLEHYLSASYHPTSALSVTPAFGYYDEKYSYDARTVTKSASISFAFKPESKNVQLTAYGSYDAEKNRDWGQDTKSIHFDSALVWSLRGQPDDKKTLSFHVAYDGYMDAIYSDNNSDDFSAWLILKIGSGP